MPTTDFIAKLPKIELHAHLNGSLKTSSILELGEALYGAVNTKFTQLTQSLTSFNDLDACFEKFQHMHDLTSTRKGLMLATQLVIRDFAADGVIYLEIRTTPKTNKIMTKREYLESVLVAISTAKEVTSERIIVKLLPSIDRSKAPEEAAEMLKIVLEFRQQSPHYANIIPGIDLSGNPKCNKFKDFKQLLENARLSGLKLTLHCAEIDNPDEIVEMLAFGMERCGHGTFLTSTQISELATRNIAIECCLTSNVKCATVKSYNDHHFKEIFEVGQSINDGNSLVLCTDDSGVFGTTLTEELQIAADTFALRNEDLARLQMNAVAHAFITNEDERHKLREEISNYCKEQNVIL